MTKSNFRTMLMTATVLMGAAATPAFAQATPEDAAEADSGDIVVTATRRATTLQDAPINISALSSETLARQRVDDVKGLAAFTPGLTVSETGPSSTGFIIMRGISSSSTSAGGSNYQSTVGIYLGEVPLYYDFKLLDINRVEVLQGPQGTLYGLGTLSGAVRYMPNRPNTDKYSIDAHVRGFAQSHSSDAGVNGDATINIPIVRDHIALRSTVGYFDNPGFIDYNYLLQQPGVSNPQPVRGPTAADGSLGTAADYAANFYSKKDVNFERTFTTRNQLLLELNPDVKLFLTYAHQETRTDGRQANGAGVLGTGRYEGPWRFLEPTKRSADLYAGEFNIGFSGFAQLVATAAITKQKNFSRGDNTDLLLDLDYGYEAFPEFSSYNTSDVKYKQFNGEVRLVSTHGGPLSWVIGGFYNNLRQNSFGAEYTPGYSEWYNINVAGTLDRNGIPRPAINRPDNLEYISFVNLQLKEKAAYGEATYQITDKWQVTGGLRYFKYDASNVGGTDTPLTGGGQRRTPYPLIQFDPARIRSGATGDDGFVWKVNTSYKFSDELMAYATYSTGYRTGNVNRVAPCVLPLDPDVQNVCALPNELVYTPDKTRNAEIGVRAALFDKRLQITASGFHIGWSDIQIPSRTVNGATGVTINGGKAVSQGFDLSATVKVTPELVIQGTYSYTDAHLTEEAVGVVVSQGVAMNAPDGSRLPGSTKNSGSIQATYTYPLGEGRDIEANWAATYRGNIYSRVGLAGNGEVIPGYVTHRASLTYHSEWFDLGLFADNIFDKYAVTAISNDISSFNQVRSGVIERYYARGVLTPRRVGVDFRFHY